MLFVELQRVDHTQHFVDVTTQRQIVLRHGGEQYHRLRQSGKSRAASTPRPDVRYRKLSQFHASRRRPLRISPGQCRPIHRQGCCAMRCGQTQSRKTPTTSTRFRFFITFIRRSAQTGKQSDPSAKKNKNGRFTIGVLFEVEFINNLTATSTAAAVKSGA